MYDQSEQQPTAATLHEQGRLLGQQGRYDEAIGKFTRASELEPDWAYPVYDMAYTYLLKQDDEMALVYYKQTDSLEPKGFFTTKTAIYTLEGEKAGVFPKGLYRWYLTIEWTENHEEKIGIAEKLTRMVPDFAPAWKELGALLDNDNDRLEAIEQGLSKSPDAETKGILLLNKALILKRKKRKEEADAILQKMISSPESTTSNINLARHLLQTPF